MRKTVLEVGLTGGIGSGKTTVGLLLADRGAVVIDADAIVRELQAPGGEVFVSMVQRWGDAIVATDGTLNRQAVADIVFNDAEELTALNELVHPAVNAEMTARREALAHTDTTVVLDIPLLIESGYDGLGGIIVVDVPVEIAIDRLVEHRGFSRTDAEARMANQVSRDDRRARADFIVDNSGDLDSLRAEVDRCWAWLMSLERPEPGADVERIRGRHTE